MSGVIGVAGKFIGGVESAIGAARGVVPEVQRLADEGRRAVENALAGSGRPCSESAEPEVGVANTDGDDAENEGDAAPTHP